MNLQSQVIDVLKRIDLEIIVIDENGQSHGRDTANPRSLSQL